MVVIKKTLHRVRFIYKEWGFFQVFLETNQTNTTYKMMSILILIIFFSFSVV
jgi:hypothetical protein